MITRVLFLSLFALNASASPLTCRQIFEPRDLSLDSSTALGHFLTEVQPPRFVGTEQPVTEEHEHLDLIRVVQAHLRLNRDAITDGDKQKIFTLVDDPNFLFGHVMGMLERRPSRDDRSNYFMWRRWRKPPSQPHWHSYTPIESVEEYQETGSILFERLESIHKVLPKSDDNPWWLTLGFHGPEGRKERDSLPLHAFKDTDEDVLGKLKPILDLAFSDQRHRDFLYDICVLVTAAYSRFPELVPSASQIIAAEKNGRAVLTIPNKRDRFKPGFMKKGPTYETAPATAADTMASLIASMRRHLRRDILELYPHDLETVSSVPALVDRSKEILFWNAPVSGSTQDNVVRWRKGVHEWVLKQTETDHHVVTSPQTHYVPVSPRVLQDIEASPLGESYEIISNVDLFSHWFEARDIEILRYVTSHFAEEYIRALSDQRQRIESAHARLHQLKMGERITHKTAFADLLQIREDIANLRGHLATLTWKMRSFNESVHGARPDLLQAQMWPQLVKLQAHVEQGLAELIDTNQHLAEEFARDYHERTATP